mgnify:CR=1 FL=1
MPLIESNFSRWHVIDARKANIVSGQHRGAAVRDVILLNQVVLFILGRHCREKLQFILLLCTVIYTGISETYETLVVYFRWIHVCFLGVTCCVSMSMWWFGAYRCRCYTIKAERKYTAVQVKYGNKKELKVWQNTYLHLFWLKSVD